MLLSAALACTVCGVASADSLKKASPESRGMSSERLERIDEVVEEAIADELIPGAVVSVVRGDRIVWLKAYGNKSVVPDTVAMTEQTIFDLASCSKTVGTTLAIMQLIEQGRLRLQDKVKMYFPDFLPWKDPETGKTKDITVRDLLTHSSGLAPYINVNSFVSEYGENSPAELMKFISTKVRRNFKPGTNFMYSCLNFITLQNILEQITGQRLCDYAEENIFKPLGLEHTCYFPLDRAGDPELIALCAPTEVQKDGLPLVAQVHDPLARRINWGNSGNAGMFSNAEDLSVIASSLICGGVNPCRKNSRKSSDRILSPMTIALMAQIPPENDPSVGRALGWDKNSSHSSPRGDIFDRETTIEHTGYTGTSVLIDFKTGTAVIILAHRVHPKDEGSVLRLRANIANIVAGAITCQ